MKKNYQTPQMEVFKIEIQNQVLAGSVNASSLDGFYGYGGDGSDEDEGD